MPTNNDVQLASLLALHLLQHSIVGNLSLVSGLDLCSNTNQLLADRILC